MKPVVTRPVRAASVSAGAGTLLACAAATMAWAAMLVAGAGVLAPAAAAWRETGFSAAVARWKSAEAPAGTQIVSGLHAVWSRGETWEASLELAGARSARDGATLGPRAEGALLLRMRPSTRWLLQAGVRSPGGLSDLEPAELALARELGEPLLALPAPEPVRGARFHAGVARGVPLGYDWGLVLSAGFDWADRVAVIEGAFLDPGMRATGGLTLETERDGQRLQLHLELAREGEETLSEAVTRSARTLAGGEARAWVETPPVRLAASAALASSGVWRLPDPEVFAASREEGPARQGRLRIELRPGESLLSPSAVWQPEISCDYARLFPRGLPFADGWRLRVTPGLAWTRGAREMLLRAGWDAGRMRAADAPEGVGDGLSGWSLSLSLRWKLEPNGRASRREGE